MSNDILIVRVYLHEADQGKRKRLMQEILTLLQDRHAVQAVTVFRADCGPRRKRRSAGRRRPAPQCRSTDRHRVLR